MSSFELYIISTEILIEITSRYFTSKIKDFIKQKISSYYYRDLEYDVYNAKEEERRDPTN